MCTVLCGMHSVLNDQDYVKLVLDIASKDAQYVGGKRETLGMCTPLMVNMLHCITAKLCKVYDQHILCNIFHI